MAEQAIDRFQRLIFAHVESDQFVPAEQIIRESIADLGFANPWRPQQKEICFWFPLGVNPQFAIDQNRNHLSNHFWLAEDVPVDEGLETFQFFPQLWINHRLPDQAVGHRFSTLCSSPQSSQSLYLTSRHPS